QGESGKGETGKEHPTHGRHRGHTTAVGVPSSCTLSDIEREYPSPYKQAYKGVDTFEVSVNRSTNSVPPKMPPTARTYRVS
ncbi:MAG: hypothetical protein QGF59_30810, partial [Pirellulaceae bacterium]|nr:hypothetical protein [Pirellulaceae bacterium]